MKRPFQKGNLTLKRSRKTSLFGTTFPIGETTIRSVSQEKLL
jgi:hypothetical protein